MLISLRNISIFIFFLFFSLGETIAQYEPDSVSGTKKDNKKEKKSDEDAEPERKEGGVSNEAQSTIYKRETIGGALLHSNGWGINLAFGNGLTAKKWRMLKFEFVHMRHPKEIKSFNPRSDDSRGYKYGKLNNFYIIRGTIGLKKVMFEKIRSKGVQISYHFDGGPSLGLTKPVYLRVQDSHHGSPISNRIKEERYDPEEHQQEDIFGGAPWVRGLEEIKPYAGLSARTGINFEYSPKEKGVMAIEVGGTFDIFAKRIPIMAFDINNNPINNDNLFFNLYISIQYGIKHYR